MTYAQPTARRPIAWIVALFAGPVLLPVPLLVLGLVASSLALVYASIAVSLLVLPCWAAAVFLLVRTR
jgi:hypothetical protein